MLEYTKNGKVIVWMNLLGFERNDADRGVKRFLETAGFKPDGICGLLCHPDFYLQHRGMEEEYVLPPDICAYWGVPRNLERERQEWTNYDLRELVANLKAEGIEFYGGVFGCYINSAFHKEWVEDHRELLKHGKGGKENSIFVLKRFKDGSFFEDYFAEKMCKTLSDYGMAGAHFADRFCPPAGGMLHSLEFSTDFVDQFLTHGGLTLPEELMAKMGDDSDGAVAQRADYIYSNLRLDWISFNAWRWESFFRRICSAAHAKGKKILTLAMYCTDPFETLYCIGISLKRLVEAGVDYITANLLPTGCYIGGNDDRPYFFHKYMALAPTTAAHLPKGHLISMLGVQDATEEWNAIYDRPVMHQRDMYTMTAYHLMDKDGISRCLDGFFLCLGDGLTRHDWEWEHTRLEAALSAKAVKMYSPMMLWSEKANEALLPEYISTRRWSAHKFLYELQKSGSFLGGTILPEAVDEFDGVIFAPNFDLLSPEEQQALIHRQGAVLATAKPDFNPSSVGAVASLCIDDPHSAYPMRAFLLNRTLSEEICSQVSALLSEDDGAPSLRGDLSQLPEPVYTLTETLVFQKVSRGFIMALGKLLSALDESPVRVDKPCILMGSADGAFRLYIFNDSEEKYHRAFVRTEREVADTRFVSAYPILPPKFMDAPSSDLHHIYKANAPRSSFQVKIQPGGVTIIDIYSKD